MAAPRRYTDEQRAAMFRLFQAGMSPIEISRQCESGTAGVAPFKVPRRTVHEIVTAMAAEAGQSAPSTLKDASHCEALEHYPVRVNGIISAELDRQERKQRHGRPLSLDDLDRLEKATKIIISLELRGRRRVYERASLPAAKAGKGKNALDDLARRMKLQDSSDGSDA